MKSIVIFMFIHGIDDSTEALSSISHSQIINLTLITQSEHSYTMLTFPSISSNINNLNDSMFTDTVYFVFLSLKQ